MNSVDRIDEKLTDIAVNIGCVSTPEIIQAVSDLYRELGPDDNLQILQTVSRTGINTVRRLVKASREVQRELSVNNTRRAEAAEKARREAAKEAEASEKPKPKGKAGNVEAPA